MLIRNRRLLILALVLLIIGALVWLLVIPESSIREPAVRTVQDSPQNTVTGTERAATSPGTASAQSDNSGATSITAATPQATAINAPEEAEPPSVASGTGAGVSENSAAELPAEEEAAVPRLGEEVFAVIDEVQQLQQQGEWEAALDAMNALYRDFDSLNDFEKVTLLNFYTNTLLRLEMWQESITAFSQMLEVPNLRPDLGARALMALGQLHARVGEHDRAVVYYQSFLDATAGMNNMDEQRATVTRLLAEANRATQ